MNANDPILTLEVVADPVAPTPEAAFALLRRVAAGPAVECVRFAWSPQAARVELVNPDDLLKPVVRRRAAFRWLDILRARRTASYAVQKVAATGSTLVPVLVSEIT